MPSSPRHIAIQRGSRFGVQHGEQSEIERGGRAAAPFRRAGPIFPLEVFENILDIMSFGIPLAPGETHCGCLLACALVCRGWYPKSISLLYETVPLDSQRKFQSFARAVRADPRARANLSYLSLSTPPGQHGYSWALGAGPVLAQYCPNLAELVLVGVSFAAASGAFPASFACYSRMSSITTLDLDRTTFSNPSQLARFLCSFRALNALFLDKIEVLNPVVLRHGLTVPPTMRSVQLENAEFVKCPACLWSALLALPAWSTRSLVVKGISDEKQDIGLYQDFLSKVSETLVFLDLDQNDTPAHIQAIAATSWPVLKNLSILAIDTLHERLQNLSPIPSLEKLELLVGEEEKPAWEALDIFVSAKFPNLKTLIVTYVPYEDPDEDSDMDTWIRQWEKREGVSEFCFDDFEANLTRRNVMVSLQ